jgi:hypothetical protein
MAFDFSDFYIIYLGHPRFNDTQIIEDDVIRVIIQKWELIIFTNRGELFCDPEFGGDLPKYLHGNCIISDIDMIPLSKKYFIDDLKNFTDILSAPKNVGRNN